MSLTFTQPLLGWSAQEWAIASGTFPGFEPTHKGAIDLKSRWQRNLRVRPQSETHGGHRQPTDYRWAERLYLNIARAA